MKLQSLFLVASFASVALGAEGYFESKGVKIRYVTEGEGEAVVLIHGWMSDATFWGRDGAGNPKLSPLEGFKLIALDCRGHGKSDKPHDVKKYGKEMASDVLRLLDHLEIKKAHLVGYSMGAFIAAKVAAMKPERILGVVYGGQAPLLTGPDSGKAREIQVFADAVASGKGLASYILEFSPPPKPSPELAETYAKIMFKGKDVVALAEAGNSFGSLSVTEKQLAKCKAPSLFLYGDQESDNLKARVEAWTKVLTRSKVSVIPGGNHVTAPAKPAFGEGIVGFLRSSRVNPNVPSGQPLDRISP